MNTQTTKVKNGTIVLPKEFRKSLKGKEVFVRIYKDKLIIEKPKLQQLQPKIDWKAWKKAAGILRGRRIPHPIKWQREIRQEWERKLL